MSNYELKAEVGRLEEKLREIEQQNRQLRTEINTTVQNVGRAESELLNYNQRIRSALENASGAVNNSFQRALSAYELQGQIDGLYKRYKNVELANKKIRALNNKKYYDFNNYRTVRKIVQGMMDNLDLNMVSDAVIYKSIERQHLKTPDFWLTPALISVMAWRNDDKLLAGRAVEHAVKLDRKNSSIFYMIFNMRMGRDEAAVKWFLEYQKCDLKGDDENTFLMLFSLISKTLSENVDEETSALISDYIHKLIVECAKKEGYSENDIIGLIQNRMLSLAKMKSFEFPVLAKYCKDYGSIIKMLNMAGNNYNILEFILKVVNVPVAERNTYLKEYLNELLAKPNEVEIETYNEIAYNELIIRLGGDADMAKQIHEQEIRKREQDLNIISSMIGWIYDFGNEDVSGQMRLNMFTLVKTLQEKAAESYFAAYRSLEKDVYPVEILDYTAGVDFTQEAKSHSDAESFYGEQQKRETSAVKNTSAYISFGAGVICGAAAYFVHLFFLAGLGLGLVLGAGILISNSFKKKSIRLRIQKQKETVLETLHKLFADYEKMKAVYKEYDEVSGKILEEYAKL